MRQFTFGFNSAVEGVKRDAALDLFEAYRGDVLEAARLVADEISSSRGSVTAPQVLAVLRERGFGDVLDKLDRRFMGAVFRSGRGWVRLGWEPGGSHKRPVSIWARAKSRTA